VLSQIPSPSLSPCPGFESKGQLSLLSKMPSLSSSSSHTSPIPSPSLSAVAVNITPAYIWIASDIVPIEPPLDV
jgi:hypothetical protein